MQNGNLTILDPIWTTAYVTRNHGYFIYDTLFASDENNAVKPQMVDKYEVSADKTVWTFTLRDGLEWHDGKPVTSEDCIASIKRWGKRDAMGHKLMDFVKEFKAVDAKTFQMILKEPYGLVLDSLGKPSSQRALHDAQARRRDRRRSSRSTARSARVRSSTSTPSPSPARSTSTSRTPSTSRAASRASGLAGGKVVKVDRVEIIEMPDPQQQVNALIAGEIDLIEQPPHDLIPLLKKEKGVTLVDWNPLGHAVHHPLQPPGEAVRQSQDPPGRALFDAPGGLPQGDRRRAANTTRSAPPPSSAARPTPSDATNGLLVKPDFEKSKALLKEAGYDGTPIVLMQSTTLPVLTNTAPVTKALLEQGGFKVDMQSMDWQTLVTRRTKKDPADKGGWNVFHTFSVAADILNPISTSYMVANGDKSWFGWPTDPEMEKMRDAYAKETDPAKGKALAEAVQARALETAQYRLDRPVVRPGCHARQRHRLAQGAGAGDVEHREEVTMPSSAPPPLGGRRERARRSDPELSPRECDERANARFHRPPSRRHRPRSRGGGGVRLPHAAAHAGRSGGGDRRRQRHLRPDRRHPREARAQPADLDSSSASGSATSCRAISARASSSRRPWPS